MICKLSLDAELSKVAPKIYCDRYDSEIHDWYQLNRKVFQDSLKKN